MTAPQFDYTKLLSDVQRGFGEVDAATSEFQSWSASHRAMMEQFIDELHRATKPYTPPNPLTDPSNMVPATPTPQLEEQRRDLIDRAKFWNIQNPEQMDTQDLESAIRAKRAGIKQETAPTTLTRMLLIGAGAEAASSIASRMLGNAIGNVEQVPGAGRILQSILNADKAKNWLYGISSKLDESNKMLEQMQPAGDRLAFQVSTGIGKMTGYLFPAVAAWEVLGAAGAVIPETSTLPLAGRPLARLALKGALTSAALDDPLATSQQKVFNAGIGAIMGAASMYGRISLGLGGATIGGGIGSAIGNTPEERQRNMIEGGIAGGLLGAFAPSIAPVFGKVKDAFKSPLDVAENEAIKPPGEELADYEVIPPEQISANPPSKLLQNTLGQRLLPPGPQGPSGGPPPAGAPPTTEDISSLMRSEPTRTLGPSGVPESTTPTEAQTPAALGAPAQPAGFLMPPRPEGRYVGIGGGWANTDEYTDLMDQYERALEQAERWRQAGDTPAQNSMEQEARRIFSQAQASLYAGRNIAVRTAQGFGSVHSTNNSALIGSKVAAADGTPLRVYHGTAAQFGEFDMSKADPEALFGPGLYHTESTEIAGGYTGADRFRDAQYYLALAQEYRDGAAKIRANFPQTDPNQISTANFLEERAAEYEQQYGGYNKSPNIRPSFLDIKNPFDVDHQFTSREAHQLIHSLEQVTPGYDWEDARSSLTHEMLDTISGDELYQILSNVPLIEQLQGPEQPMLGNWLHIPVGENAIGKAGLNQALRQLGFDGITHIGGRITNNAPHRVWIALDPSQVHPPWNVKPLDVTQATETGEAISKQATVLESGDLPNVAGKEQITESDAVTAAKTTNPAGVSILKNIGKPLDVLKDHPDVHFVEREGKIDALVGPVSDAQMDQYSRYGLFEGQKVVTSKGIEGTVISPSTTGNKVTVARDFGPPLRLNRSNVMPSRFGAPQVEAPDLWDSFKADLLRYMNEEASDAGMAPVENIWDTRVPGMIDQHVSDYLNRRGIFDPATRQVVHAQFNRAYVEEAKDLDPEMRDIQAKASDAFAATTNEREASSEPVPTSLEEKAEAKGFIWLTRPGSDGGTFKDILNPESGQEVPVDTDHAAEEFLQNVDRAAPDHTPISQVPWEVMESIPSGSNLEPSLGHEEHMDMLSDVLRDSDAELEQLYYAEGGGQPPVPPPLASGGAGFTPPPGQPQLPRTPSVGAQYAALKKNSFDKYQDLQNRFTTNTLSYLRYWLDKFDQGLADAGIVAEPRAQYERMEAGSAKARNAAAPWLNEYGQIMDQFKWRILRDGSVTRIHEIEDPNARYAAWYRLMDSHGYDEKQIQKFIKADDQLADFNHRWFGFLTDDPSFGLTAEREIFRYMSHVRAKQAAGAADPYDSTGLLSPNVQYFAEFARDGNLQFRVMDARTLGNYMIRAGMFKKYVAAPWEDFVNTWQDPRIPDDQRQTMMGYARNLRYGYDASGELAVRGIAALTKFFGIPLTNTEAARVLGLPVQGMYMSALAANTKIFFREATLPLIATAKVRAGVFGGVYKDILGRGDKYEEALQRGLEGGWVLKGAPSMEAASAFEEPVGLRNEPVQEGFMNKLLGFTPQQGREAVARILDVRQNLPYFIGDPARSKLNLLNLYDKHIQNLRLITGEAAWRQATTALEEYRKSQLEAAMQRDPDVAMTWDDLSSRAMFGSFPQATQRQLQELVANGEDKEAADVFAREVTNWTMGVFQRRELPKIVQSTFGRVAHAFGNTSWQFVQGGISHLNNTGGGGKEWARYAARYLMTFGAVSAGLDYLHEKTGWGFKSWIWGNMFKYMGSPVMSRAAELYGAATGAVALSDDRQPAPWQEKALEDVTKTGVFPGMNIINPYAGYVRDAQEIAGIAQSNNPVERSARFLVTGDRGEAIDLKRMDQQNADLMRQWMQQADSSRRALPPLSTTAPIAPPSAPGAFDNTLTPPGIVRSLSALQPEVQRSAVDLIVAARAAGHNLVPLETMRSQARQDSLFAQGRTRPGDVVTWTQHSRHTQGRAVDFDGDSAALQWLQQNAHKFGFNTLGQRDPGHVEMPAMTRHPGAGAIQ